MSETKGEAAAAWWRSAVGDRDSGAARGLAARLRRAEGVEVLAEPAVQDLARRLGMGPSEAARLVRLVRAFAELREDGPETLARRLGGAEPVLSPLRFQRLLRASGPEFDLQLRRALVMADRRCNATRLAADLLVWDHPERGDPVRARWCFDYFGAPPPAAISPAQELPA
jgi:CRISPR system Cascade subunit CasB